MDLKPLSNYPPWLNVEYFQQILKPHLNQFKIVTQKVEPITEQGNQSIIYRVSLTCKNTEDQIITKTLMVKTIAEDYNDFATTDNLFPKEIYMYSEVLTKIQQILNEFGKETKIGPDCYLATNDPREVIIMEDLSSIGFQLGDGIKGLGMEEIKLVISKLAQFHAASAVYLERENYFKTPVHSSAIIRSKLNGKNPVSTILYDSMVKWKCSRTLEKYGEGIIDVIYKRISEFPAVFKDRFNVMAHGDLWLNNILFKYNRETGDVEDCRLLDFQFSRVTTPIRDLHRLVMSSAQHQIKLNEVDHILQYYYSELVGNLREFGYSKNLPTLLELQMDFDTGKAWGLIAAFTVLPMGMCPSGDAGYLVESCPSVDDPNYKTWLMYNNPDYVKAMEDLVPYFEREGYFDYLVGVEDEN